jgi:hypothetical protein
VAYKLRLPSQWAAIHGVFHISQLKKCVKVPTEIVETSTLEIEPDLSYIEQPLRILDTKERFTRRRAVKMYKILWDHHKKRLGKLSLIFNGIFQISFKPIPKSNYPFLFSFRISGRDSFKGGRL